MSFGAGLLSEMPADVRFMRRGGKETRGREEERIAMREEEESEGE